MSSIFKIPDLNVHQKQAIRKIIVDKEDVFVNLLTSFGKLLIYQALPLVFDRVSEQTGHNRKRGFSIHTRGINTCLKILPSRMVQEPFSTKLCVALEVATSKYKPGN